MDREWHGDCRDRGEPDLEFGENRNFLIGRAPAPSAPAVRATRAQHHPHAGPHRWGTT